MSGELILESGGAWKRTALTLAASCLVTLGLALLLVPRLHLSGLALAASAAVLVYVIFRVLYPAVGQLLPHSGGSRAVPWTVTAEELTLGDVRIPRSAIKQVHCWPNRDALGHAGGGWIINIETTGKNQVLRSLSGGADAEESVRRLHALVNALGCGERWQEG